MSSAATFVSNHWGHFAHTCVQTLTLPQKTALITHIPVAFILSEWTCNIVHKAWSSAGCSLCWSSGCPAC